MSFVTRSFMPLMRVNVRRGRSTRTVLAAEARSDRRVGALSREYAMMEGNAKHGEAPQGREVLYSVNILQEAERHHDEVQAAWKRLSVEKGVTQAA